MAAFFLSLAPQSPFRRTFDDPPYLRSETDSLDHSSTGTVKRHDSIIALPGSSSSLPLSAQSRQELRNENTPPRRSLRSYQQVHLANHDRTPSPQTSSARCRPQSCSSLGIQASPFLDHDSIPEGQVERDSDSYLPRLLEDADKEGSPTKPARSSSGNLSLRPQPPDSLSSNLENSRPSVTSEHHPRPFKRWMSTLKRKNFERSKATKGTRTHYLAPRAARWDLDDPGAGLRGEADARPDSNHRRSLSWSSSLGFVTAIKSATLTLASFSTAAKSRHGGRHGHFRPGYRSSRVSSAEVRKSCDSGAPSLEPIMEQRALDRAMERHRILEELIHTEQTFIADLKVFSNLHLTTLGGMRTPPKQTLIAFADTVAQVVHLHETLLTDLCEATNKFENGHPEPQRKQPLHLRKHTRFHSVDHGLGSFRRRQSDRRLQHSLDIVRSPQNGSGSLMTEPKIAAGVAKVFSRLLGQLFVYEEYAANYDEIKQDLAEIARNTPSWTTFEKGIEALSHSVIPIVSRETSGKKGLTIDDLLIKPIQRICKYPLIFENLRKETPVADGPESHAEIEKTLLSLRDAAHLVNQAKTSPALKTAIKRSRLLRDRLVSTGKLACELPRSPLGHVLLCGVLHLTFQKVDETIDGHYMVCALYKSWLLLAMHRRNASSFNVVAAIVLADAHIMPADEGGGLQCITGSFTWKFVFETGRRFYELLMTACTPIEEAVWKRHLEERASAPLRDPSECCTRDQSLRTTMCLNIKSVSAKPYYPQDKCRNKQARRNAVDDLGIRVIIKNTQAAKEEPPPKENAPEPVKRSHSVYSTSHIPVLSPKRSERARLETAMYDMWTKELLPYPGLPYRRSESAMRVLPHAVMRKISMGSITSTFSKRSASYSTISHQSRIEEINNSIASRDSRNRLKRARLPSKVDVSVRISQAAIDRPATAPLPATVDFHTAPTSFLPLDFDLDASKLVVRKKEVARPVSLDISKSAASQLKPKPTPISQDTLEHPEGTRSLSGETVVPLLAQSSNSSRRRSISVQKAGKPPATKEVSDMVKDQNVVLSARLAATPFASQGATGEGITQQVDGHADVKKSGPNQHVSGTAIKESKKEREKMSKSLGLRDRSKLRIRRLFMV